MYIIIFLIILAVLVLVHEFGHFYAAKRAGVRVDEFGLGFPPRLWSKKIGETVYSLNAIPFGGFVKIFGENYETGEETGAVSADSKRSFVHQSKWVQVAILVAGIVMNVIFAWLLLSIAYMSGMTTGVSDQYSGYIHDSHVIVLDVAPDSAAAKAGIMQGDQVVSYGFAGATTTVANPVDIQKITKDSKGRSITFQALRGADTVYIKTTPALSSSGNYAIGISMDVVGKAELPFYLALWEGAKLTGRIFAAIFGGLYGLIHDAILGHADLSQLSGPVGIARLVGDASRLGFTYLMSFTAFISLNLAVLNLVPFPALDGGRILFVAIEAIRRKAIDPRVANTVNAVGFGLLLLFMLFVTYRDVLKMWG